MLVERGDAPPVTLEVIDASLHGFLARASTQLPQRARGAVRVQLGDAIFATENAVAVRRVAAAGGPYYGFRIATPGPAWRQCIAQLDELHALSGPKRHEPVQHEQGTEWSVHDLVAT